jgi:beta-glucosidase
MSIKTLLRGGALFSAALSCAAGVHAEAGPAAAQPWRDATQRVDTRVEQLFRAMSFEQKIALVSAVDPAEYAPLAPLGIPALTRVDASAGLRGDRGVTAFPVPLQLGATFDTGLAREVGQAIAEEARGKGWNVILGPTVDVARDGRSGRLTESFGEDPVVSGEMGAAVASGIQDRHVIAMGKHYTVYHTERDRLTMEVKVPQRALHEVYNIPFDYLVEKANIASLMGSYPKVNGKFMLENKALFDLIKKDGGFNGYMATDFMGGADGVAQFNAGVDSWSLQPFLRKPEAFREGKISAPRLDDAVRRMLWALFSTGTFDAPVTTTPAAVVTTPQHQALALRVAEEGTVLLKNEDHVLPLKRTGQIAVIGPAGKEAVTGVMWSTFVDPGQFVPPLDAIAAAAGNARVVHAQGSTGDVVLPTFGLVDSPFAPPVALLTPDGKPGWNVRYFGTEDFSGPALREEAVKGIDVSGRPLVTMPAKWSAAWSTDYTPDRDGLVRLAASVSGRVKVKVDGQSVIDGMRSTADGFPGAGPYTYPLQGTVRLARGKKVRIEVEYASTGAFTAPRIQLGWQAQSPIPDAVALASKSDVAVVFVNQVTGEEMDRDDYRLPADQDALIEAVAAVNKNTVVVLNTGGAVAMPWLDKVKGVVQMWYPGVATGTGIARVLFGDADPGGRLPVSFLADASQGPKPYLGGGTISYDEGVMVGYRYLMQHGQKPAFPFGHGLSYSSYRLDGLTVKPLGAADGAAAVSVHVRNTGSRSGTTVVQVYSGALPAPVETPKAKLVGFAKIALDAGAERTVTIPIDRRLLSYWDEKGGKWVTPKGNVPVAVGFSSEDIVLRGELSLSKK